jgi:hypothetical protein
VYYDPWGQTSEYVYTWGYEEVVKKTCESLLTSDTINNGLRGGVEISEGESISNGGGTDVAYFHIEPGFDPFKVTFKKDPSLRSRDTITNGKDPFFARTNFRREELASLHEEHAKSLLEVSKKLRGERRKSGDSY